LYKPPQPTQQSLSTATTSTFSLATAPTPPSLPPAQYPHPSTANTDPNMQLHIDQPTYDPCLPQNKTSTKAEQNGLHKAKPMAKKHKQPIVNTLPLGAHIASICQPKALFNLPFATQSLAVIWEKEHPSQRAYTTFFTNRRYRQQYQNPPPTPPFQLPVSRKAV
jgi:hypothetical protein